MVRFKWDKEKNDYRRQDVPEIKILVETTIWSLRVPELGQMEITTYFSSVAMRKSINLLSLNFLFLEAGTKMEFISWVAVCED